MKYPIKFGTYLLLERVNVGGMAEIFKAKAFGVEGFERILAIKRILPTLAEDHEFINMFVDEARIAVQLSHDNIAQIHELGKHGDQYYIAMEYVAGKDVRHILDHFRDKNAVLPLPAAAFITAAICEGLDYAHRKADPAGKPLHVVHRDISPQNVLVSYDGAIKVTDFGIAKAEDRASKTQAGVLKGKFAYMSPEQVRGLALDQRSDVFAVGILLYEMVTGQRLFLGDSDFSTLEKVRNAEIPPPKAVNPDLPPELEAILLKALAKDRDERYQWASELQEDLQQFLIVDNTIYNATRLAALLKQEFKADIELEMHRTEELMQITMPSSPEELPAAGTTPALTVGDADADEATMIFESGASGSVAVPDQVGGAVLPPPGALTAPKATGPSEVHVGPSGTVAVSAPQVAPPPGAASVGATPLPRAEAGVRPAPTPPARPRQRRILLAAATTLLMLLVLAGGLWLARGGGVGTIEITSEPTQVVDVYLNDELVGDHTPLELELPAGNHEVVARAKGYRVQRYGLEVVPGSRKQIAIELQPTADGILEVRSSPSGASVRIAGQDKGRTPLTLTGQDRSKTLTLEVALSGFATDVTDVSFSAGETRKNLLVELQPEAPATGRVVVKSKPEGAVVRIAGERRGVTPVEIDALDTSTAYDIELSRDGYRTAKRRVEFGDQNTVEVAVALEAVSRGSPRDRKGSKPRQACSGSSGRISVMARGESDCRVKVGNADIGVTPFANKKAPTGRCDIKVTCPSGKRFKTTRTLSSGRPEKVIIREKDWR